MHVQLSDCKILSDGLTVSLHYCFVGYKWELIKEQVRNGIQSITAWHWFSVGEYKCVMLSCKYHKIDDCRQLLITIFILYVSSKFCAANAPELK